MRKFLFLLLFLIAPFAAKAQISQATGFDANTNNDTYSAGASFAPSTGVFFASCGSNTKTIRIIGLTISGTDSPASTLTVSLLRTSTAPSAGTAMTNVSLDTSNATPTSLLEYFTTTPTAGTSLGAIRVFDLGLPAGNTATNVQGYFRINPSAFGSPIVLHGASQCIELSTATSTTGITLQVSEEWYETAY
ncbi:MAG: hypothetical protein KGI54_14480 [Pseudomonadota bacterium]|nr:hypothetical protein [Pseudomonadota bacterium]